MIRLTIIIPVYNSENFVKRCIDSLMRQGLNNEEFEIILIDDGSIDNSYAVILKFAEMYSNIYAFHKENGGTGHARNFGFDKIKGKYVYFLDVDDYLADNSLATIINMMDKDNLEIGYFNSKSTTSLDMFTTNTPQDKINVEIVTGIDFIADYGFQFEVWRYIINTDFLFNTGLSYESEKLLEDSYFTVRLFIAAKRMGKINLDAHRYVQEPTSAMNRPGKAHGQRILNDLQELSQQYYALIKKYKSLDHPNQKAFLNQLELKKEFFVYFAVLRSYKGEVNFRYVWQMLQNARDIDAYPFNENTTDNDPFADRIKYISNRKPLLYFLFHVVRPLDALKQKVLRSKS